MLKHGLNDCSLFHLQTLNYVIVNFEIPMGNILSVYLKQKDGQGMLRIL